MFKFLLHLSKFIPTLIIIASLSFGIIFFNIKAIIFAILCLICNFINFILKNYFFKPLYYYLGKSRIPILGLGERPHNHPRLDMLENYYTEAFSFGMPSGHAQSILFFATFWIIYILYEFKKKKTNRDIILKCCSIIYLMCLCILVIYNRYYFKYHTIEQLVIGGLVGIGLGILFFYLCRYIFLSNAPPQKIKVVDKPTVEKENYVANNKSTPIDNINIPTDYRNPPTNNRMVQQGTIIKNDYNTKAQQQDDIERDLQRMSYDFHSQQINDYINNHDDVGHYQTPKFTRINKVNFNEQLSQNDNQRFSDNVSFNQNYAY
jgi:membrane-associated phospholipid phosphatase